MAPGWASWLALLGRRQDGIMALGFKTQTFKKLSHLLLDPSAALKLNSWQRLQPEFSMWSQCKKNFKKSPFKKGCFQKFVLAKGWSFLRSWLTGLRLGCLVKNLDEIGPLGPFIFESMEAECDLVSVCPHVCHRHAARCPCGDPALTPPEEKLHCHVAFGSEWPRARRSPTVSRKPGRQRDLFY